MEGKTKTALVTSRHTVLLFFTSASVLAYEILLMRLLSISFWHHFAYMVISLALLGFGASGSFLFFLSRRVYAAMDTWLVLLAGAASLSFPLAFSLAKGIGLDPLQLVWQNTEWLKMFTTYLVMAVPFFSREGSSASSSPPPAGMCLGCMRQISWARDSAPWPSFHRCTWDLHGCCSLC